MGALNFASDLIIAITVLSSMILSSSFPEACQKAHYIVKCIFKVKLAVFFANITEWLENSW